VLFLVLVLAVVPVLGNLRPELISFLPSMRYYAGNWATSVWLFRTDGSEERFDSHLVKPAPIVAKQLTRLYDAPTAELLLYKGLAFRSMHSHGRALNGLLTRAVDDLDEYIPREGELVAGVALGWNFGEGHLHNERLLDAVQFECEFTPGQVRVITVESQPFGRPTQRYRILDAADGLLEEGTVRVADLVERQPWLSEDDLTVPVEVSFPTPDAADLPESLAPEPVAAEPVAAEPGGAEPGGAEPGGPEPGGAEPGGPEPVAPGSSAPPPTRPRPRPAPAEVALTAALTTAPEPEPAAPQALAPAEPRPRPWPQRIVDIAESA
jgi:hypothetical protein